MRIIQFVGDMATGGAQSIVRDYAIKLKSLGHEVRILTLVWSCETANTKILASHGIQVESIYDKCFSKNYSLASRITRVLKRDRIVSNYLEQYIKRFEPDVIHIHLQLAKYFTRIDCSRLNTRLIYTVHNKPELYFRKDQKEFKATKILVKNGLRFIAMDEGCMETLKRLFHTEQVIAINNPIDLQRFHTISVGKSEMKEQLGIPRDALVVGNIGRLEKQKNHHFILEIFNELQKYSPNAYLVLVGSGSLYQELKNRINTLELEKHVVLLQNRADIPEILSIFDVFLMPSFYEGLPVTLIEAQAMHVKCVVSNTITRKCIFNDNISILSLDQPAGDWVESILNDKSTIVSNSQTIEDFGIDRVVQKLLDYYG